MSFLVSAEVAEAATDNIMAVHRAALTPSDRSLVRETVVASLRNISAEFSARAPSLARALGELQLPSSQRELVLVALRLGGEPLVQRLGLDFTRAAQSAGKGGVQVALKTVQEDHMKLLERCKELVPHPLMALWVRHGHLAEMPFNFLPSGPGLRLDFEIGSPDLAEKYLEAEAGAVAGMQTFVGALQLCVRSLGVDVDVPAWGAPRLLGEAESDLLACHGAAGAFRADARLEVMRVTFCPLKFGALGLEVLRAVAQGAAPSVRSAPSPRISLEEVAMAHSAVPGPRRSPDPTSAALPRLSAELADVPRLSPEEFARTAAPEASE